MEWSGKKKQHSMLIKEGLFLFLKPLVSKFERVGLLEWSNVYLLWDSFATKVVF